jgi:hypothetical protein
MHTSKHSMWWGLKFSRANQTGPKAAWTKKTGTASVRTEPMPACRRCTALRFPRAPYTPALVPAHIRPSARTSPRPPNCAWGPHAPSCFPYTYHVQHPIYFWNIRMQHLQHTSQDRWNIWNMLLKYLQKTPEKIIQNHCKYTQHSDKILATYVWKHMQHIQIIYTCNIRLKT